MPPPSPPETRSSTIMYEQDLSVTPFPTDDWVTFNGVEIEWCKFKFQQDGFKDPTNPHGKLNVEMTTSSVKSTLVDNRPTLIGRNDNLGYYFKCGMYWHTAKRMIYYLTDFSEDTVNIAGFGHACVIGMTTQ